MAGSAALSHHVSTHAAPRLWKAPGVAPSLSLGPREGAARGSGFAPEFLDVAVVAEEAAADAQDHWAVPRLRGREGRIVALGHVPLQQRTLTQAGDRPAVEEAVELAADRPRIGVHDAPAPFVRAQVIPGSAPRRDS